MEKKFTVKLQKVGDVITETTNLFSTPLVIEPEDDVSVRRGLLYSTVEVSSSTHFDSNLILKVISDTFQSDYFHNISGSPLQALERSITTVRDKIFNLLQHTKDTTPGYSEFHIVAAVLWGSVLYVVQYGNGCAYLVREGKVKPINTSSEGNFSVASGIVKENDVVILGSKGFCEKYSPDSLAAASPSIAPGPAIAAVLLKFVLESEGGVTESLEISDSREDLASKKISIRRGYGFNGKGKKLVLVAVVLGVALLASVIFAFQKSNRQESSQGLSAALDKGRGNISQAQSLMGTDEQAARKILEENKKLLEEARQKYESGELDALLTENLNKLDELNKVKRVEDKAFYDLKIDDKDINPSEIVTFGPSHALVVDSAKNKYVKAAVVDSPSSSAIESTQSSNPRFLSPTETGAAFVGSDAFFTIDSGNDKIEKSSVNPGFPFSEVVDAFSYIGNFYTIRNGAIYKNSNVWAQDEGNLKNAVSMAVDGDIYVLISSGSIVKFSSGEKKDFAISGLSTPLSSAIQVYTSSDFNNLYILDKGNLRIVVLDKEGRFKVQYLLKDGSRSWEDARGLSVSRTEKNLFLLSGSKIYKFSLE